MNESYKNPETENEKMEGRLIDHVNQHSCTADELQEAYFLLCGISEAPASERVLEIKGLMEVMSDQRYPLNGFVRIIDRLGEWEGSELHFSTFVESLNTSQKEKNMLESIVKKKRVGELDFIIDGNSALKLQIGETNSSAGLAYALRLKLSELLKKVGGGDKQPKITFWFEEKKL